MPRELSTDEVAATVDDFRRAAAAAIAAGADGVEIHGANGYLVNQFLFPSTNQRTDQYGAPSTTASVSRWRSPRPWPTRSAPAAPASGSLPATPSRSTTSRRATPTSSTRTSCAPSPPQPRLPAHRPRRQRGTPAHPPQAMADHTAPQPGRCRHRHPRQGRRRRSGRRHHRRHHGPRQPRPRRAHTRRRTPQHPRPQHLLRRRSGRLHRLPHPRRLTARRPSESPTSGASVRTGAATAPHAPRPAPRGVTGRQPTCATAVSTP